MEIRPFFGAGSSLLTSGCGRRTTFTNNSGMVYRDSARPKRVLKAFALTIPKARHGRKIESVLSGRSAAW